MILNFNVIVLLKNTITIRIGIIKKKQLKNIHNDEICMKVRKKFLKPRMFSISYYKILNPKKLLTHA